jgi:hypothetical protein
LASASRFFVPQPPVVQPSTGASPALSLQPSGQRVDRLQPWMYAAPMAAQPSETSNSGLLYGVGAVVVSLAVGGAMGGGAHHMQRLLASRQRLLEADEANSLSELRMISSKQSQTEAFARSNSMMYASEAVDSVLERRQLLLEQDEAESVQQLEFLSEKQKVMEAFAEKKQLAVGYNPAQSFYSQSNSVIYASAAMDSLIQRRQMLLEQDEAESSQQLEFLSEKQKLEETRQMLFNFDAQMQAVQETVGEAVMQTVTAGEEYARQLPGALPGIGFFDPLGILTGSSEEKVQYYRDAELKHGRIGTLAAIGIIVSESFHPFGGDELNGVPAILAYQHGNMALETMIVASAAALASRPQMVPDCERKQTTEIWHVRGGMLAAFGMIAQEAITNTCLVCV